MEHSYSVVKSLYQLEEKYIHCKRCNYIFFVIYYVFFFWSRFFVYFFQEKQTPLHLAAQHGQLAVCNLLLELGASLDSTDDYGQKPIHLAAKSNKPEVVKLFLKQRTNLVSVSTKVRSDVFKSWER